MKTKNLEKINKAAEMYRAGKTQKEIAAHLGVTEKTISVWLKPYKAKTEQLETTKSNFVKRINSALVNNEPASVIRDLAHALSMLKNL